MKIVVVLGNRMKNDGQPSPKMLRRLALAEKLYEEQKPDMIILSGGIANKRANVAEADFMYDFLLKHGIPQSILTVENESLTTRENVMKTAPIIIDSGADELIICSTYEHINRISLNPVKMFKRALMNYPEIKISVYTDVAPSLL